MHIRAYAKVNLSLDVISKRKNGYHDIRMVLQSIDLYDTIHLKKNKDIKLICDGNLPQGSENIAYKAAELILNKDAGGKGAGATIVIDKKIPQGAGLAGGSADAAAVLKGLNYLYNMNLSETKLQSLGLKLGADVPFCIKGGTVFAQGIGERMTSLPTPDLFFVLVKPDKNISTKNIYDEYDMINNPDHVDVAGQVKALMNFDYTAIIQYADNALEQVTKKRMPEIEDIKRILFENKCENALMSGSGSTVFGIYRDLYKAEKAYDFIKDKYNYKTYLVRTLDEESANGLREYSS